MKFNIIDLETTGLSPVTSRIVEIASQTYDSDTGEVGPLIEHLVNPGISIPTEASVIHHILDEDVVDSPTIDEVIRQHMPEGHVLVAHNSVFEKSFIGRFSPNHEWLCTMKMARLLFPDCPSHSNQFLRYWLRDKIDIPRECGMPHRAGPDVLVTQHIFAYMIPMVNVNDMVRVSSEPSLLRTCSFGKHKGTAWEMVPKSYLRWVVENGNFNEDVIHTAKHWLNR